MAKAKDPKEMAPEGKPAPEPKKKSEGGNKSFIMMFSVVIIVQLVIIIILVYFYISKPDYPQMPQQISATEDAGGEEQVEKKSTKKAAKHDDEADDDENEDSSSKGPVIIYQTDDLIINPKGARAGKYLMAQIGLSVASEEVKKEFQEERKAQIYDILNGYLASQSLEDLSDITKRDSLKINVKQLLNKSIKGKKVKDVFFSKYIVQ